MRITRQATGSRARTLGVALSVALATTRCTDATLSLSTGAVTGTSLTSSGSSLLLGHWGALGADLAADRTHAVLSTDCRAVVIDGPIVLDAAGTFVVSGFRQKIAGPSPGLAGRPAEPVIVRGRLRAYGPRVLEITITPVSGDGFTAQTVTIVEGVVGRVLICP